MSSTDDSYSMSCSLPSSLEQTPLSSLSAASSYSSLVNCDETISIPQPQQPQQQIAQSSSPSIERKSKKIDLLIESTNEVNSTYNNINKRSPYSTLLQRHINKLCSILEQPVEIHGQGNFPTLNIVPKDFLIELRRAFYTNHVNISDIRLNGGKSLLKISIRLSSSSSSSSGAASYVLTNDKSFSYTDIDFVFRCDLSSESTWTQIKTVVCECLSQQISSTSSSTNFSPIIIQTAYVEKIVRVINPSNNDSWALISLYNIHGQNIELKFVDRMKRQFQFSVDSFQILIYPLLDYYEHRAQIGNKKQAYHHGKHQLVNEKRQL